MDIPVNNSSTNTNDSANDRSHDSSKVTSNAHFNDAEGVDKAKITSEIIARVNDIFIELFDLDKERLQPQADIYGELGLDSLDTIDLMIAFENKFKMKPVAEEARTITTMQDIYDLVMKYYEKSIPK